jgi:hypothetical protein
MSDVRATKLTLDKRQRFEQVCALAKDVDLTTPEGEQQVRKWLEEYDLPQHMIYGIHRAPITEDTLVRAEQRLAELKASGDVP